MMLLDCALVLFRFYEKKTGRLEDYSEIGKEVGEILKSKSNNSYKR